ncbi:MAG: prolipoprotein diacylglyceryl transferase family protein [Chloroflexota bacterium]
MNLFSLLVGIGASFGLLLAARSAPPGAELRRVGGGLLVLLAALTGARAGFVWLNPHLFQADGWAALRAWEGGLSFPGGLAAAVLAVGLVALAQGESLAHTADGLVVMFVPLGVMVWLGCGAAGCAFGAALSEQYPWSLPVMELDGSLTYRFGLPYLAAPGLLVFAWLAEKIIAGSRVPGLRASALGLAIGLHILLFTALRGDDPPRFQDVRLDTAAALFLGGLSLLGLIGLAIARLRSSLADQAPGANRETWFSPKD